MRTGVESFSLSAMQTDRFFSCRRPKTSSSNHDAWRNSNAARTPAGSVGRKASSSARSFLRNGGSWNSSVPSLLPSAAATSQKRAVESPASFSRLSCVMRRGAFSVNRYGDGTCSAQPATSFSVGIR